MSGGPLVTVAIVSYDKAAFLPAAIESALAQTYPALEIVVADDGSTDGSLEIAEAYAASHPGRLRVVTHPGNEHRGIAETANLGVHEARGVYWSRLDADDVLEPKKTARQVALLQRRRELGLVYGRARLIDAGGRPLGRTPIGVDITRERVPLERLIRGNPICASTVIARRDAVLAAGLHDRGLLYEDWDLWLRVAARWRLGFLRPVVVRYRVHAGNMSAVGREVRARRSHAVMAKLAGEAPVAGGLLARPHIRALLDLQAAFLAFCAGDLEGAERSLEPAFARGVALGGDGRIRSWLETRQVNALHPRCAPGECETAARWLVGGDHLRGPPPEAAPARNFAVWLVHGFAEAGLEVPAALAKSAAAGQYARLALDLAGDGRRLAATAAAARALVESPALAGRLGDAVRAAAGRRPAALA